MQKRDLLKIPMPEVVLPKINLEAYRNKYHTWRSPCFVLARIVPGSFGEEDTETVVDDAGKLIVRPVHKGEESGVLVVWILRLDGEQIYTVYASADSAKWCVRSHVNDSWREAMLRNLTGYCAYREHEYIYADEASAALGHYFGSTDYDTLRSLDEFQRDNRTYRTRCALVRSRREIDALMDRVPGVPKDIERYIDNHVMKESRYLWYHKEGKTLVGVCSHCKKTVRTDKYPKGRLIDREWKCPACGSTVTIKSINRSATVHDHGVFGVVAPMPDGIMLTVYSVNRIHRREDACKGSMFYQSFYPERRTHITYSGNERHYEYTTRNNSLYPTKDKWYVIEGYDGSVSCKIYPYNLKRILADTRWKYTGLPEFARSDLDVNLGRYLRMSIVSPPIEKMAKLGLYKLAHLLVSSHYGYSSEDILGANRNSASPLTEILKINKTELRMFTKLDITPAEFAFYCQRRALGKAPTEKDLRELRAAGIDARDITDGDRRYGGHYNRFFEYATLHKVIKFVTAQKNGEYKNRRRAGVTGDIIRDWRDYLSECLQLGYDLRDTSILMPKNLISAHTRTSAQIKYEQNKEAREKIEKRRAALESLYNLERDGYIIRMARDGEELIYEGKMQGHCVGGYIDKYARGDCTILLLRKSDAPDVPLATIELHEEADRVREVQIRAQKNRDPDEPTMKWWRRYKKDVLDKLGGEPYAAEHGKHKKKSAKKAS